MSISPSVDEKYRLHVADLEGRPRRLVIANVTLQGLETATPVLHFEGQHKRLVLSQQQVQQMIRLTGTSIFERWIGHCIVLRPPRRGDDPELAIAAPTEVHARSMPVPRTDDQRGWRLAWAVVGLLGAASLLFLALEVTGWLARLQALLESLLQPFLNF